MVTAPVATSPDNAPVVTVEVGAPVAPVVRGLPGRTRMSVGMSAPTLTRAKTTYASLGSTTSDAAGSAKVPAFKASRAGVYTIQLATAQGKAFYLKINVAAKKASKSVTNKVVANK